MAQKIKFKEIKSGDLLRVTWIKMVLESRQSLVFWRNRRYIPEEHWIIAGALRKQKRIWYLKPLLMDINEVDENVRSMMEGGTCGKENMIAGSTLKLAKSYLTNFYSNWRLKWVRLERVKKQEVILRSI